MDSSHFEENYKNDDKISIRDQLMMVKEYPIFFNEAKGEELFLLVTMVEVKEAVQASVCSKITGSDGWTNDLFMAYLDFMGQYLLEAIEESRVSGAISGTINSTFLAPIPKKLVSEGLGDFRPISLCNFVYKVISTILDIHLKTILSRCIYFE